MPNMDLLCTAVEFPVHQLNRILHSKILLPINIKRKLHSVDCERERKGSIENMTTLTPKHVALHTCKHTNVPTPDSNICIICFSPSFLRWHLLGSIKGYRPNMMWPGTNQFANELNPCTDSNLGSDETKCC